MLADLADLADLAQVGAVDAIVHMGGSPLDGAFKPIMAANILGT